MLAIEAELSWDRGRGRSEVLDHAPSGGWVEITLTKNALTVEMPFNASSLGLPAIRKPMLQNE
jgi:hypothetical protein